MRFLTLIAGTNEPSNSALLAQTFSNTLSSHGHNITTIRLKDTTIDHFTLACYASDFKHEDDLLRIRDAIDAADGIVIAMPIWNFAVPAHLKNLIDRLGTFYLDVETRSRGLLNGKPFYCIFTGGAPTPAWTGMMKFTTSFVPDSLRYFGANPVGSFFEGKCVTGRGTFGLVVDKRPQTLDRIRAEAQHFLTIVTSYARTGKAPLRYRLKGMLMHWIDRMLRKFL